MHICTTKSLRAGLEDIPPIECPICKHVTMYSSWVSLECDTCGADTGYYLSDDLRHIRERTGMTRKQIAKELGYSQATVKNYEWTKTSQVYLNKFKRFIEEFYK